MYLLQTAYTNVIDSSVGPACGVSPAPGLVTWPLLPSRSISVTCLCSSKLHEGLNAFLHVCHEPSLLIYRRELGLISRKYYRLWLHPVFSVVGSECGVPITKRRYSFYKQSLYGGDQFVIMAVITKNNTVNTRIHLYRQPATETWRWITTHHHSRAGKPQFIGINVILTMVSDNFNWRNRTG